MMNYYTKVLVSVEFKRSAASDLPILRCFLRTKAFVDIDEWSHGARRQMNKQTRGQTNKGEVVCAGFIDRRRDR